MSQLDPTTASLFFEAPVSQFDGINPNPVAVTPTVSQVVEYIATNQRLKNLIEQARDALQEELLANNRDDKGKLLLSQYDEAKKHLIGVTWAGTFSTRHNSKLKAFSGFLSFDIDYIEKHSEEPQSFDALCQQAQETYQTLTEDPHIAALFYSVSGTGIKGLVKIPPVNNDAEYKTSFRAFTQYLADAYEITLDSLPDISRLCFLSSQEDPYINKDSAIYTQKLTPPKKPQQQPEPSQQYNSTDPSVRAAVKILLQYGVQQKIDRNEFVGLCAAFKRTGLTYQTFDQVMQRTPGYNPKENFKIWNTVNIHDERHEKMTASTIIKYARDTNKPLFLDLRKEYQKNGDPDKQTSTGLATMIERKLLSKYTFRLNMVSDQIIVGTEEESLPMSDYLESMIRCWLSDRDINKREITLDVIKKIAYQNRFNPIEDYFTGLQWNGEDTMATLGKYFFDSDTLFPVVFRAWCVGAVRRVFTGQHHQALIFAGEQGKGKSFFARWLCPLPEYHIEHDIKPDTNDAQIRVCENFIWEVAEFGKTSRQSDIEDLKQFIALEFPKYRRSHDKYDQKERAIASFIGTVNLDGSGFLNDPTGSRRWWPIEVKHIDFAYAKEIDRDQIWAQAYALYKDDAVGQCEIPEDVQEKITTNIENEFSTRNPMEDLLLKLFEFTGNDDDFMDSTEILMLLAENGYQRGQHRADTRQLAQAMRTLMGAGHPITKGRRFKVRGNRGYLGIKYALEKPVSI